MTRPKVPPREQLIPLMGAAKKYDLHYSTLRNWIRRGELTAYRFGAKKIYVDERQLDAMMRPVPTAKAG